jgi:hypothetical protein
MGSKWRGLAVALALTSTLVGATVALGAGKRDGMEAVAEYLSTSGDAYVGVRSTAIGLPQIGIEGTAGASELFPHLRHYHDSGRYEKDLALVGNAARAYLRKRLDDDAAPARRVRTCKTRYRRVRSGEHKGFYKRSRKCSRKRVAPKRIDGKPAIVLDIDETTLSNYDGLQAVAFSSSGLLLPAALGTGKVIRPTLELYKYARSRGVAVFFITGRPSLAQLPTEANLRAAGFTTWDGLQFKPSGLHTEEYKAGARAAIEKKGYEIVVNGGDQESDLDGGHADRAFKYPNPFYFISD